MRQDKEKNTEFDIDAAKCILTDKPINILRSTMPDLTHYSTIRLFHNVLIELR